MPLYDYKCHKCGKTFEVRQRISEDTLKTHEGCGGDLERLISAPALHFKGSGWYVTDYAKNGKSPSTTPKESSSDTKTETKGETKTEAKTESKTETKSETKSEPSPVTK
jgi:putative FmdB family regulatory protein